MRKFLTVFIIAILMVSFSLTSFAADMPTRTGVQKTAPGATYPAGPIQKAERGFMNAVFGWTEIPKRIVDKTKESNPIKGLLLGTWQGSCKAFARTASGLADLVTFPIGGYDKPAILPDMPAAE
ncbi:exosortase system-associated protein, TIGR04073 family [Candidatus Omnitrophota bacterium]